jgi:hypothetical protein
MRVIGVGFALVEEVKVRKYLLAPAHPQGGSKARFFTSLGFRAAAWRQLAAALRAHVRDHDYEQSVASPYGVKYIVRGTLHAPRARAVDVVSVWIVEHGRRRPRFVTAYPGGKR